VRHDGLRLIPPPFGPNRRTKHHGLQPAGPRMKEFLLQLFTWWNGQTLGTRFWTWRAGAFVGSDEFGNRYYRQKGGDRRWVIYNGEAEASRIPAAWHGWMHKRTDVPPTEDATSRASGRSRTCRTLPARPPLTGRRDPFSAPTSARR